MKIKLFLLILSLSICFSLSGCGKGVLPVRTEINELEVVQIVGIDKCTEEPDHVKVSVMTQSEKGTSGENGGKRIYTIISASGDTVFEAIRMIKLHSDKLILLGYIDYILIGENAAKEDFYKFIDFFTRDREIRLSPKVYITKGCSAEEFMKLTTSEDKFIFDRLKNINEDINIMSNIDEVRLIDLMKMMDEKKFGMVIPALKMTGNKNESIIGGKMPEMHITPDGYAVIKNFKLVGFFDVSYARGYNFLIDEVSATPISIEASPGKYIGLEIIDSMTQIEAHFKHGELTGVTYKAFITSGLEEQHVKKNILSKKEAKKISRMQSEIIKNEMEMVLKEAKELQIDCIKLGEHLRMKYPLRWEKIKDRWKTIFPELKINIEVESKIARSYTIDEPNGGGDAA